MPTIAVPARRRALTIDDYVAGVLGGEATVLARAITLVESNAPAHQALAQELLARLMRHTGGSQRIGITGIPGAGKSTFIETLGCRLIADGHRVAVLAVDPSSSVSGGSILADRIRMEKLSRSSAAFIRPSPSGGLLGGVHRKTREAMLVCEAAGFDVVIVETVGVGQNEIAVHSMVDLFLVLMIAGAGDEMQGIKKGVIELADALVINKADGDNRARATAAQAEMQRVLHYLQPTKTGWTIPALLASAFTGEGVAEVWRTVEEFFKLARTSGGLEARRRRQSIEWMHAMIGESLRTRFYSSTHVRARLTEIEQAVASGQSPPLTAALELLKLA
ncbi:MAG TPA: methylmalonyl Co-A mutase-associated GTPase MeaB [Opitutus sp.]|nr:methylmalonyl Co-A mutase-associated GTPase MeaB [Opitutus sp.]